MERELFWPFYDDLLAQWVPANHLGIFGLFEETIVAYKVRHCVEDEGDGTDA